MGRHWKSGSKTERIAGRTNNPRAGLRLPSTRPGVFERRLRGPWAWRPTRRAGLSSTFPRKAPTEPKPPSSGGRKRPLRRGGVPRRVYPNASPRPRPLSLILPIIQGLERKPILLRWATAQSRTGLWRGSGSQRYYATVVWSTAQGSLGDRGGAITLSTQRATRSLLVVVLPPAAFALVLILWFLASSIVF
jgi:hypothetical protein